jgi:hypothetical protein
VHKNAASAHHEDVGDAAELAVVLRRIVRLLGRPGTDVLWSGYDSVAELRAEVEKYLVKIEAGEPFDDDEFLGLRVLFAPTGPLQETSISSGWAREFLDLAARFDAAS